MNKEGMLIPEGESAQPNDLGEDLAMAEAPVGIERNQEVAAREMLHNMEIADARLDIEGASRLGSSWERATEWAKAGWDRVKRPPETYTEAVKVAALLGVGTTVFFAPGFLAWKCGQVYMARREKERGSQPANA